jgi:hypothetical protein
MAVEPITETSIDAILTNPTMHKIRVGIFAIFYIALFFLVIYLAWILARGFWVDWTGTWLGDMATKQFKAVVMVPVSAVMSFALVWAFSVAQGAVEVKIGGLEFKGASSHILFWLVVFLGIVSAINLSWLTA